MDENYRTSQKAELIVNIQNSKADNTIPSYYSSIQ